MKLCELAQRLNLEPKCGAASLDREVLGGYASDLLSDVLAHAREGDLWVTLQTHENIVAVAAMRTVVGIVLVNARQPQEPTLERAIEEGMPILVTPLPAFEIIGRLYELGIRGEVGG